MSVEVRKTARDAYLAWQAEIGTEEVLLVTPPPRRAAAASPAPASPASRPSPSGPSRTPSPEAARSQPAASGRPAPAPFVPNVPPSAGPEFFGAIAEQLKQADRATTPGRRLPPTQKPDVKSPLPAVVVPPWLEPVVGTKDLEAYWRLLDAEVPRWFPGASAPVARASGHALPRLAVVELASAPEGPFTGDEGALLDRMMTAIGLTRDQLYLTSLMKAPLPAGNRGWARKDTARMVPVLMHELKLAQCGLVLIMGETCAQAVLKTGRAIPDLLRLPTETEGLSLSATWHPAEVRAADQAAAAAPDAKAARPRATQAWEHLQWLRGLLPAR